MKSQGRRDEQAVQIAVWLGLLVAAGVVVVLVTAVLDALLGG